MTRQEVNLGPRVCSPRSPVYQIMNLASMGEHWSQAFRVQRYMVEADVSSYNRYRSPSRASVTGPGNSEACRRHASRFTPRTG